LELVNLEVKNIALLLLKKFKIPNNYLYTLEDTNKKIILQEIKEFIVYSRTHPGYDFQIFFIQNISRLTITSANSLLKFFEEPKRQNIIFLTNT
jgi:DNA polymerase III delta prime subunit